MAVANMLFYPTFDAEARSERDFIEIEGGLLTTGDPDGEPDEVVRALRIEPFRLMRHEVTNRAFGAFVRETGHQTDPELAGRGYVWDRSLAFNRGS